MMIKSGRVIFDGTTELTYSNDIRKKISISSRLEDRSTYDSSNYSFIFKVSHPHTSVDVDVASNFGSSKGKLTGSVDVKYLTARQETKQFTVNGEMDKLRKGVSLNVSIMSTITFVLQLSLFVQCLLFYVYWKYYWLYYLFSD